MAKPSDFDTVYQDMYVTFTSLAFRKVNLIFDMLMRKPREYSTEKINVGLEIADQLDNVQFTDEWEVFNTTPPKIFTNVQYLQKELTSSMPMSYRQQKLISNSTLPEIKNQMRTKFQNLLRSTNQKLINNLYKQEDPASNAFANLYSLLYGDSVGGLTSAEVPMWKTMILNRYPDTAPDYNGDARQKAQIMDPSSDVYYFNILQDLVTTARSATQEDPNLVAMTPPFYNLIEEMQQQNKMSGNLVEKTTILGFTVMKWHNIVLYPDFNIQLAQAVGVDYAPLYALNLKYLYMYFAKGAKFDDQGWSQIGRNQNSRVRNIISLGGMCTSNKSAHAVFDNVWSKRTKNIHSGLLVPNADAA